MNVGCYVVVLDGDRGCTQNKATNKKTRINCEQGQCIMYVWGAGEGGRGCEGDGEGAQGQSLRDIGHGE